MESQQTELLQVVIGCSMMLLVFAGLIPVWWKILTKAGYNGWWSLISLLPVANLILLVWIAAADWPVRRELRAIREQLGGPWPES